MKSDLQAAVQSFHWAGERGKTSLDKAVMLQKGQLWVYGLLHFTHVGKDEQSEANKLHCADVMNIKER